MRHHNTMQPTTQMHDRSIPIQFVYNRFKTVANRLAFISIAALLAFTLSGCGPDDTEEPQTPLSMRAPQPTFTPTVVVANASAPADNAVPKEPIVVQAAEPDNSAGATGGAVSPDEATVDVTDSTAASSASTVAERVEVENGGTAVVNIQLLNGRAGPGAEYDLVGIVGNGEFFDIIGRNDAGDWWEVCCYLDTPFWVADEFVDIQPGSTGQVVSVQPTAVPPTTVPATAAPTALPPTAVPQNTTPPTSASAASQPAPAATAPAATEPDTSEFSFALKSTEQFPETNVVRIFLYVFQNGQALPGFSLKVTKDGADIPVNETSFGPNGGFTWPVESARQRFQNMKVEFPDQSAGGTWIVQLVDGSGAAVGPEATFTLAADDEEQEMYVRYEQN